jgi:hypothetical protein
MGGADITNSGQVQTQNLEASSASIAQNHTQLFKSSDQTVVSGNSTVVTFGGTTADNLGAGDDVNNQLVIPEDGSYLVNGAIQWRADVGWSTGDICDPRLENSGFTPPRFSPVNQRKVGEGAEERHTASPVREFSQGDAIQMVTFQDSGGDKVIQGGSRNSFLNVIKVG